GAVGLAGVLRLERVLRPRDAGWLWVLNDWPVCVTRAEGEAWEEGLARSGLGPLAQRQRLPEPWRSRVTATWERIFDLEGLACGDWPDACDYVQAVFERLDLDDVVRVAEVTARESGGSGRRPPR